MAVREPNFAFPTLRVLDGQTVTFYQVSTLDTVSNIGKFKHSIPTFI